MALVIHGSGQRIAESFDGSAALAPSLQIVYLLEGTDQPFVAYNDLSWHPGQLSGNITVYTTNAGPGTPPYGHRGHLMDYGSGAVLPVVLTVRGGSWSEGLHVRLGNAPRVGTDADRAFRGMVDTVGVIAYSRDPVTLAFDGLGSDLRYRLTLYGDRGQEDYFDRFTNYTLHGAVGFTNESSIGTDVFGTVVDDDTVTVVNGFNTVDGHVARFAEIQPGEDGRIRVEVTDGGSPHPPAYYVSSLRLEAFREPQSSSLNSLSDSDHAEEHQIDRKPPVGR